MKMTLKSFLAGFVACSMLLSSFTCVFAEEPLQVNDVTAQIQVDVDSTAIIPNQPESVNEQESQPEKEPENKPGQSNVVLDESDSKTDDTEINLVDIEQSQKLDNKDLDISTKDETEDGEQMKLQKFCRYQLIKLLLMFQMITISILVYILRKNSQA